MLPRRDLRGTDDRPCNQPMRCAEASQLHRHAHIVGLASMGLILELFSLGKRGQLRGFATASFQKRQKQLRSYDSASVDASTQITVVRPLPAHLCRSVEVS
jgi:hypothetical protein